MIGFGSRVSGVKTVYERKSARGTFASQDGKRGSGFLVSGSMSATQRGNSLISGFHQSLPSLCLSPSFTVARSTGSQSSPTHLEVCLQHLKLFLCKGGSDAFRLTRLQ